MYTVQVLFNVHVRNYELNRIPKSDFSRIWNRPALERADAMRGIARRVANN